MRCLFFVALFFWSHSALSDSHGTHQSIATTCLPTHSGTYEQVARVTDGDTIVLEDGRRVRVIGVNALEMNSKAAEDQIWADTAKTALNSWIGDKPVKLVIGKSEHDRYGRTLAHLLLENGRNAAEKLIENGLALAVSVGKNSACAEHFQQIENQTRQNKRGIWQKPGDWLVDTTTLRGNERGFRLVISQVKSVRGKKRKTILYLRNGLEVKLGSQWRALTDTLPIGVESLVGKTVAIKGWLSSSSGRIKVTLNHPANLRVVHN